MENKPYVLTFDVFGTVLDWRGSLVNSLRVACQDTGLVPDFQAVATEWANAYGESIGSTKSWTNLDVLLAAAFGRIAPHHGLHSLPPDRYYRLATAWSRLDPWGDAAEAFDRLIDGFTIAALTNASTAMLKSLATHSGLPWDVLISAEKAGVYKPDPKIYKFALNRLDMPADRVLMVAAHCFDLNAAQKLGFRTALIRRPTEPGSDPSGLDHEADYVVDDLVELANCLLGKIT